MTTSEMAAIVRACSTKERVYVNREQGLDGEALYLSNTKARLCCGYADPDGHFHREVQGFSLAVALMTDPKAAA